MAKNGKKWQKMAKIVFFYIFKYILLLPTKVPRTQLMMSYAAAVVSVGAKAPVAPAPDLSYAPVTAKNAPEPGHRCNVGHCDLCNMLRDPIGYGGCWLIDEHGIESGM